MDGSTPLAEALNHLRDHPAVPSLAGVNPEDLGLPDEPLEAIAGRQGIEALRAALGWPNEAGPQP
ncbi:hypothetical protein IAI18_01210 [Acetobacteraceae bacterium H6797]|nr:hypothetical protein [Acetobacteraceae bacterium H6797]